MAKASYQLWVRWFEAIQYLRPACARSSTFLWFVLCSVAMSIRTDIAGVSSFMRCSWLQERCYKSLLNVFNGSGINLDKLTSCWTRLCVLIFDKYMFRVNGRIVLIADGIKVPKEGKKMPAVKCLHQESSCNAKAEFIMGHSCQVISLVSKGITGIFAVPLVARIHEGVVFSNLVCTTLLDKLVKMLLGLELNRLFYLIADAYYASKKVALPLLQADQHLIARARTNAVAHLPIENATVKKNGRPKNMETKLGSETNS